MIINSKGFFNNKGKKVLKEKTIIEAIKTKILSIKIFWSETV